MSCMKVLILYIFFSVLSVVYSLWLHRHQYYIVFVFPEVMQARGQMSKGDGVAHQQPIHFFSKVCLRSNANLNDWNLPSDKESPTLINLPSNFTFSMPFLLLCSRFFLSHSRHLISFVRLLPWATPLSKTPCHCVIYWTILEIYVGVSIAIRTLIKAPHTVLLLRRQQMKGLFSIDVTPWVRPIHPKQHTAMVHIPTLPLNHTHLCLVICACEIVLIH